MLSCVVTLSGADQGVSVPEVIRMADIPIGRTMDFTVPIRSDMKTRDGELELGLKVREPGLGGPTAIHPLADAGLPASAIAGCGPARSGRQDRGQVFTYQFLVRTREKDCMWCAGR